MTNRIRCTGIPRPLDPQGIRHIAEKSYDAHTEECPNLEIQGGPSNEFLDRIRGGAMGAADETPMSDVLLEFCGEA